MAPIVAVTAILDTEETEEVGAGAGLPAIAAANRGLARSNGTR